MALTDSDNRLKRTPDNDRKVMKSKADRVLVADASESDINSRKLAGFNDYNLSTLKELGVVNPTLTEEELKGIKEGTLKKPTGIFNKENKEKKSELKKD